MTQNTILPWIAILLITAGVAVPLWWQAIKRRPSRSKVVDPDFSSKHYVTYLYETLRFAGFSTPQITDYINHQGQKSILALLCDAEELLLVRIIESHFLKAELKDDWRIYTGEYRQGKIDELRRGEDGERKLSLALELLKKLNPLISKVVGGWIGEK